MEEHQQHQINAAVQAALSPGPLQSQAYEFLQNVKAQALEAWPACLACFLKGRPKGGDGGGAGGGVQGGWEYEYAGQTRLFALQVVDAALVTRSQNPEAIQAAAQHCETVRQQLMEYVEREFVQGDGEGSLIYLRNKVVQTFFILFMRTYLTTWPDFFSYFASLLRKHPPSTQASPADFNPRTTDLFLRVLHEVSVEVSDNDLRLNKEGPRLELDGQLRDAVRARDATGIAQETFAIVASSLQGLEPIDAEGRVGLVGRRAVDCLEMGVRVVADYVPWIDISLIVTPTWIPFLYQALRLPHVGVRLGAAEAILATVTKGMPPENRLQLYGILGVTDVLTSLLTERKGKGKAVTPNDEDDEGAFHEKLAKILNGMGVELCKICDEASASEAAKSTAYNAASGLLPLLLDLIDDPHWPVCLAVLPLASALLTRYKKEKKTSPQTHLNEGKRAFLSRLLELVILKMRYPPDDIFEWEAAAGPGEEDDEDVVAFGERRKALKLVMDAVAWVDEELFRASTGRMILSVVDALEAGGVAAQGLDWQQVELVVYVLYLYGEAVKGTTPHGPQAFVAVPPEERKRAQKDRDYKIDYAAWPLSPLGEIMTRISRSPLPSFPHPSVPLQWFECVVRYHDFFTLSPNIIPTVLPAFLDERGVHQEKVNVRARCFYLLYRFIAQGRGSLAPHINQQLVQGIFERLQDVLVIDAQISPPDSPGVDILTKVARTPSLFDSQLYLYETVGILTSMLNQNVDQQTSILHAILDPLVQGMQRHVRTEMRSLDDLKCVLMVHHYILAIGSVAKGFPDLSMRDARPSGAWAGEFKSATDTILSVTKVLAGFQIIRDAARASFNKIVATIGTDALPHVPLLIDCLLNQLTTTELVDFLAFVGQLIHKYKAQFQPLLDDLLIPLLKKVFESLEQPITGTDDIMAHSDLRRAYFSLLTSIMSANMEEVLFSPKNVTHLQTVLDSVPHYTGSDHALANDQKMGLLVLNRFIFLWVDSIVANGTSSSPHKPHQNGTNGHASANRVPDFHRFVYEKIVPLCFSVPSSPRFDWGDAQSYQVLQEMSNMLKTIFNLRGQEFVNYMLGSLLPSIGCPPEPAQGLMQAVVSSSDGKQSRKPLVDFWEQTRNSWRAAAK